MIDFPHIYLININIIFANLISIMVPKATVQFVEDAIIMAFLSRIEAASLKQPHCLAIIKHNECASFDLGRI
jgi:hypothetical protein